MRSRRRYPGRTAAPLTFPSNESQEKSLHVDGRLGALMTLLVDAWAEQALSRIIDRLRIVRLEADITQNALAEVLPVRGRAISEWETEAVEPTYDHLLLLAGALGQRLVIMDRGVELPSVRRRPGEPWVLYERRRLAWPLRGRRRARRMSLSDVGELVGVSADSIGRWELTRVPPRPMAKIVWVHTMECSLGLRKVGPPDPGVRRGRWQMVNGPAARVAAPQ